MAPGRTSKRDPWFPAFVFALTIFAGSLLLLAVAVAQAVGARGTTTRETAASDSGGSSSKSARALTYTGALPAKLADAGLVPAVQGRQPDISFEPGEPGERVTARLFVPVAAMGAGIDALTREQLLALVSGKALDWAKVGGVAGEVKYAMAGPDEDRALVAGFAADVVPGLSFATYGELRAAMTMDSGIIAFVPLNEVRVSMSAIAVDGVDIVRGRGDSTAWPFAESVSLRGVSPAGLARVNELRSALAVTPPKVTRIVATGDILQSRCTLTKIRATGDWTAPLKGAMAEYLAAADLALGSLDGSIQDIGTPYGCVSTTNLTSPPEVLQALTLAGFDEVTVATNHVFDCGQSPCGNRAFLRTLELLAQSGIKTVGGGKNLEEALAPAIFEVNGVKFGVLGFDDIAAEDLQATATEPGTAPLDDDYKDEKAARPAEPAFYKPAEMLDLTRMQERIRTLKQQVDVVIVQVQSGYEDTHEASPRSIKALRAAVDAGADLVVGNQGHHVQSAEVRGDAFIAYALGNFIFDQVHTAAHTEGYLLEASFWGKQLANVRMVPYHIVDQYRPTFVEGELRAKILGDVFGASKLLPAAR